MTSGTELEVTPCVAPSSSLKSCSDAEFSSELLGSGVMGGGLKCDGVGIERTAVFSGASCAA